MGNARTGISGGKIALSVAALACLLPRPALPQTPPVDLTQMNIEDLMAVKVTSVSKKEESLGRTAAAVFVITQDEIRRSGATNLPDVLRLAPGVDVEQIDANAWAISIRGFNSRYSNKVQVLIDGRSVYTPSYSGVFWDQIDMPLENIERIEVIRGPGTSVWGANAVNGVISIYTKSAQETKGGLVAAAGGPSLHAVGLAQYGAGAGANGAVRVFASGFEIANGGAAEYPANDSWIRLHAGVRFDWDNSGSDSVMAQGDIYDNDANQSIRSGYIPTPFDTVTRQTSDASGGDGLASWTHTYAGGSQSTLQAYFDDYRRYDLGVTEVTRTFDIDFQDHLSAGRNDIVWGFGYRLYDTGLPGAQNITFTPPIEKLSLFSAFLQDEIRLSGSLWLTIGGKLEHNSFTGFQTEPSLRLAWSPPASRYSLWASASKAVRQPSRQDVSIQTDLETLPLASGAIEQFRLFGNPSIQNEQARDFEVGCRTAFSKNLSLDAAAFLTYYSNLETVEPQQFTIVPGNPTVIQAPMLYENLAHSVDHGGELWLNWSPAPRWRLAPGYSYLHATMRQDASSKGLVSMPLSTGFPENMLAIRSQINLTHNLEFDQSFFYRSQMPGGGNPSRSRLDLRLSRRLGESAEISLVGQNLLRPRTLEYGDSYSLVGTLAVRSVYAKITWRF